MRKRKNEFSRSIKEKYSYGSCCSVSASRNITGVKYIVNLTDTINANQAEIEKIKTVDLVNIQRDMKVLTDGVNTVIAKLERAEGTWEMAENLYEVLADKVRQMEYDIKDLNREINY